MKSLKKGLTSKEMRALFSELNLVHLIRQKGKEDLPIFFSSKN